ncbi:hypothetical protein Tco_0630739 [Tanacetum coccineum]
MIPSHTKTQDDVTSLASLTAATMAAAILWRICVHYGASHDVNRCQVLRGLGTRRQAYLSRVLLGILTSNSKPTARCGSSYVNWLRPDNMPRLRPSSSLSRLDVFRLRHSLDAQAPLSMLWKGSTTKRKQMGAKVGWPKKYSYRTREGIDCSSSQANCSVIEKELHQLRMDEEALRETLEEEAMNKKAQEEKIRQKQAEYNEFFLEFEIVRYDSEYESLD